MVRALGVVKDQPVGQFAVKERKVGSAQAADLCHQPGVGLWGFGAFWAHRTSLLGKKPGSKNGGFLHIPASLRPTISWCAQMSRFPLSFLYPKNA
jgi:hypothetical protein